MALMPQWALNALWSPGFKGIEGIEGSMLEPIEGVDGSMGIEGSMGSGGSKGIEGIAGSGGIIAFFLWCAACRPPPPPRRMVMVPPLPLVGLGVSPVGHCCAPAFHISNQHNQLLLVCTLTYDQTLTKSMQHTDI